MFNHFVANLYTKLPTEFHHNRPSFIGDIVNKNLNCRKETVRLLRR